jgi:hypothetical protein
VRLKEPQFVVVDPGVGLGDLRATFAQGLDLRADKDYPALNGFENLVVVTGATIRGDHPVAFYGVIAFLRATLFDRFRTSHATSVVTHYSRAGGH